MCVMGKRNLASIKEDVYKKVGVVIVNFIKAFSKAHARANVGSAL